MKDTGGSAYPVITDGDTVLTVHSTGMTLRDYFAGKGLTMGDIVDGSSWEDIAKNAYSLADAMIKERNK